LGLFLQIVGGVVVTLILVMLGFYFFVKIKFGGLLKLDPDENQTPLRIHLNEDFVAPWTDKKEAVSANDAVLSLGYRRGKSYSIPELPSINLTAYFKQPVVAVIYHHDALGVWLDFAAEDKNTENEITVTNGPLGSGADTRPEKQISWLKSYSVSQLHEAIQEKLDVNGDYLPIDEDNFREYFEQSHRKDMKFRARNGGMSQAEFSRHVEEIGKRFSDKDLHQAFVAAKSQELAQWSEAALEEFMEAKSAEEVESTLYDDSSYFLLCPFTPIQKHLSHI
jgi:hypothetical protein